MNSEYFIRNQSISNGVFYHWFISIQ